MTGTINNKGYIALYLPELNAYHVVAELKEVFEENKKVIYIIEAVAETFEKLNDYGVTTKNNNFIPGFDFDYGLTQRHSRPPFFITMRTVDRRRQDMPVILKEFGLEYYDQFEMLLITQGESLDNWRILRNLEEYTILNKEHYLKCKP